MSLLAMLVIAATATTATTATSATTGATTTEASSAEAPIYRSNLDTLATEVAAQAALVEQLAGADSIDRIDVVAGKNIDFTIAREHERFRVRALTTGPVITGTAVSDLGQAPKTTPTTGAYSWLSHELGGDVRIIALAVGPGGEVTLETDAGLRYVLLAGHGANTAIAARWAASWDSTAARDSDDEGEPAVDGDAVARAAD